MVDMRAEADTLAASGRSCPDSQGVVDKEDLLEQIQPLQQHGQHRPHDHAALGGERAEEEDHLGGVF